MEFGFPLCLIPVACSGAKGWRPSGLTHAMTDGGTVGGVEASLLPPPRSGGAFLEGSGEAISDVATFYGQRCRRAATWDQHGAGRDSPLMLPNWEKLLS